jgi:hypothetical protein
MCGQSGERSGLLMDVVKISARVEQGEELHPLFGAVFVVRSIRINEETGQEVSDEEFWRLHQEGRATGYCVKLHGEMLGKTDLPDLCIVQDVREGEVLVGGNWLSLADFHKYYEPD